MQAYDRAARSVGNIVHLEHFNVIHDDQRLATLFYVVGLGGTRDPYLFPGLDNMWVNYGRTQAHLPSRGDKPRPEVLRGTIGLVVPDLNELKKSLNRAGAEIKRVVPEAKTKFSWREKDGVVEATCPWGNRFRCHAPSPELGRIDLGIVYVDFDVPPGTAEGIGRFYRDVMLARTGIEHARAVVEVGRNQKILFTESAGPIPPYDGHHIQVYIADFHTPYAWLKERELITMEADADEWRFQWIVDPKDGRKLFQIEHEVRSAKHPLFNRPLVNRNPAITNTSYVHGADAFRGAV
jgi:hypothetical protein